MNLILSTRTINKPMRWRRCAMCHRPITGKHLYITGVNDGDFYASREHEECHRAASEMCLACEFRGDCMGSLEECFSEKIISAGAHYLFRDDDLVKQKREGGDK